MKALDGIGDVDILASDSANKPCFQNLTKSPFVQCSIDVKSALTL